MEDELVGGLMAAVGRALLVAGRVLLEILFWWTPPIRRRRRAGDGWRKGRTATAPAATKPAPSSSQAPRPARSTTPPPEADFFGTGG